ncbi:MAG: ribonuclease HII [Saprospiraceae bacterium]|nr:ribonuclease HII [Saprospiraceae bacterium]HMW39720.1 ribonuclease HII [Saprospiraceae bacterium]HMX89420.1 ribonuclease HII [Saprospiraceae bacterium]HMZ40070.1 ribonuclease HII [Saprospiraceae bacterium]HNA64808.1 ribonuclease HII [Saprospiraceae bacterium]
MGLKSYYKKNLYEAGCDEAGRGCLAGPVVAAAVILDPSNPIQGLRDSKALSSHQRHNLRTEIEDKALAYAVAFVGPEEIDRINILRASLLAMYRALLKLTPLPDHVLIDGNQLIRDLPFEQTCIVKGDALYQSIAAASILAKTHRDEFMSELHLSFPHYNWISNKGYPSAEHRRAVINFGPSMHHRKTFRISQPSDGLFD